MSTSHSAVEDRLARYRQLLDTALEQRPAPSVATARPARPGEADLVGLDDFEALAPARSHAWARYAMAAASVVLLVGAGLLVVNRIDTSTRVSSDVLDDTAPVACPPQPGTPDVGNPAPELDFDNPRFLVALPTGTPPRVLAVRALLNPVAGDRCLAFDPDTIETSLDQSTETVTARVTVPSAGREFETQLMIAQAADAIGVTQINGLTQFSIEQSDPNATLNLLGDLPSTATEIEVRFRLGNEVADITVPITSASSIPLTASSGSVGPEGDLVWVTFVIRDDTGLALDAGGRLVP